LVGSGVEPGRSVVVQVLVVQLIPAVEHAALQSAPMFTPIYELPHWHLWIEVPEQIPPLLIQGSPPPPVTPAHVAAPPYPQKEIPLAVVTVPPAAVHWLANVEHDVQVPGRIGVGVTVIEHAP